MDAARRKVIKGAGACVLAALAVGSGFEAGAAKSPPAGEDPAQFAAKRFLAHWNCTQAILEALGDKYGADAKTAMKMATAFAGGMTKGSTCGAVTGAYMVIGLAHGKEGAVKSEVASRLTEFNASFIKQFGSLSCSALMGTDMSTAEGVKEASEKGMFTSLCPKLVEMAVSEVEKLA